jgi:peptidoglycan/xylan/chitin deacetylase (PgdA/CDA1 family)
MNAPRPIDAQVLDAFLDWMDTSAPATTEVQTVRDVMGAPDQPNLPPRDTKVSLTFDDGLTSQYRIRTMLAGHDADGTFYINSGPVIAGEQGTMTWAQIRALESDGNEIGGHTVDHVSLTDTSTTYEYKRDQVCRDRATLLDQGFNPVSFAYPFASFNAEAQQIVQACGYQSGRTGGTLTPAGPHYSEDIPPKNAYAIRILGTTYNGPITLQSLQDAVNGAASHGGGWIPMLFHVICFEGDSTFDSCMAGYRTVSDTTLNQFLTWLDGQASNGISTATIGEVMGNTLPADTEAPTVSISDPTPDATVTTATPAIAGSAGTEPGDDSTADVEIFAGTTVTGSPVQTLTADVGAGGDWAVGADALADGTYTALASQGDTAGNTGTSDPATPHPRARAGESSSAKASLSLSMRGLRRGSSGGLHGDPARPVAISD